MKFTETLKGETLMVSFLQKEEKRLELTFYLSDRTQLEFEDPYRNGCQVRMHFCHTEFNSTNGTEAVTSNDHSFGRPSMDTIHDAFVHRHLNNA